MATKKKTEEQGVRHISETQMAAEALDTMTKLRAQPRVKFTVMPDRSGDRKIRVKLNGTVWEYAVGVEQEAPVDVYKLVKSRYETLEKAEKFAAANANRSMGTL